MIEKQQKSLEGRDKQAKSDALVSDASELVDAYRAAAASVTPVSARNYVPVLRRALESVAAEGALSQANQHYTLVSLLTCGPMDDVEATVQELLGATQLPLTVLIIGIGRDLLGLKSDGTIFPMYLSVGQARTGDQAIFVGIIYDLTEKKRAEETILHHQKLDAIGLLSGGIAHDFNNILNVIGGNLEMIAAGDLPPAGRRAVARAQEAAAKAARITQRLLAFARKQPLNPGELSLGDVLVEVLRPGRAFRVGRVDAGVVLVGDDERRAVGVTGDGVREAFALDSRLGNNYCGTNRNISSWISRWNSCSSNCCGCITYP